MGTINKVMPLVAASEQDKVDRKMVAWANTFPNIPSGIYKDMINYEFLADDMPSMALSTIQGTYITTRYILGGYQAEYQFKLIYRMKPGNSPNSRLEADELLNKFGDWASRNKPNIGDGLNVISVEPSSRSSLFGAYDNGDEDHQILMKMIYERVN